MLHFNNSNTSQGGMWLRIAKNFFVIFFIMLQMGAVLIYTTSLLVPSHFDWLKLNCKRI